MKSAPRSALFRAAVILVPVFCFIGCPEMDEAPGGTLEGKWRTSFNVTNRAITVTTEFAGSTWTEYGEAIDSGAFEDPTTLVQLIVFESGTFSTNTDPLFDEIDMVHAEIPEYEIFRTAEGIRAIRALIATAEDDPDVLLRVSDIDALAFSLTGLEIDFLAILDEEGIFWAESRVLTGRITEDEREMAENAIDGISFEFVTNSIQIPGYPRFGIYEFDRNRLQLEVGDVRPRDFSFSANDSYSRIF